MIYKFVFELTEIPTTNLLRFSDILIQTSMSAQHPVHVSYFKQNALVLSLTEPYKWTISKNKNELERLKTYLDNMYKSGPTARCGPNGVPQHWHGDGKGIASRRGKKNKGGDTYETTSYQQSHPPYAYVTEVKKRGDNLALVRHTSSSLDDNGLSIISAMISDVSRWVA